MSNSKIPLQDIAYFTIQMLVIDTLGMIKKRNEFSYILSQEAGFYVGRFMTLIP